MGNCLCGSKEPVNDAQSADKGSKAGGKGKAGLNFGYDSGFHKFYKLEEELGRGQYGVTFKCAALRSSFEVVSAACSFCAHEVDCHTGSVPHVGTVKTGCMLISAAQTPAQHAQVAE